MPASVAAASWFGATKQGGPSRFVFLLIDLATCKTLVEDAQRIVRPDSLRRDSNRPEHEPYRQHDDDGIDKETEEDVPVSEERHPPVLSVRPASAPAVREGFRGRGRRLWAEAAAG